MFLTCYEVHHCVWWPFVYSCWWRTWTWALARHEVSIFAENSYTKLNWYIHSYVVISNLNPLWRWSCSLVLSGQWGHFAGYQVPRFGTLQYRYSVLGTWYQLSLQKAHHKQTNKSKRCKRYATIKPLAFRYASWKGIRLYLCSFQTVLGVSFERLPDLSQP